MTTIARTIRTIFVDQAPPVDRPVYVLWATAVAFAVLQFALVCSMPVRG